MAPDCETDAGCIVPPVPAGAALVMATWRRLDALRDFGGGAVILAQAGLSAFEMDLLAELEGEVQRARGAAPVGDGGGG